MSIPPQHPQYPQQAPYPQYPQYPPPWQSSPAGAPAGPAYGVPAGLANIGARFGARVLDVIFWYIGYFVLAIPVMMWIDADGGAPAVTVLMAWLVTSFVLYFALPVWKFGSTLGKRICGIRVVRRESAAPMGFWRAAGREAFWLVAVVVPGLGLLNPLWCCWDRPYQQCLHDKVADSMAVVR